MSKKHGKFFQKILRANFELKSYYKGVTIIVSL